MGDIYELGYMPDDVTFIETPLLAGKIIASDNVTGEKHIVLSPDIHLTPQQSLIISNATAAREYESADKFPPAGAAKTLYIVISAGEESIWWWSEATAKYYEIANNYKNLKVIDGGNV